jgi:transcriptional regulator with XRE-family HTH domain
MQATLELIGFAMTDQKTLAKHIGERMSQVRKDQGMTQVELAEAVRLSQQLIAEYEAGKKNIPVWRLVNLAEALGIAPEVLLSESDGKTLKRGPAPKVQKQIEKISTLPREQQKSILQVLDMALKSAAV